MVVFVVTAVVLPLILAEFAIQAACYPGRALSMSEPSFSRRPCDPGTHISLTSERAAASRASAVAMNVHRFC